MHIAGGGPITLLIWALVRGAHIPRDMRPRGSISLVIWDREGQTTGGLYYYYTSGNWLSD